MIYEQMNNEELFSTPTSVQTKRLPIFPVSSLLVDESKKDANSTLNPSVTILRAALASTTQTGTHQILNLRQCPLK